MTGTRFIRGLGWEVVGMIGSQLDTIPCLEELKPGDRIEVEHRVTVGGKSWTTRTVGTVVRTERAAHGLHFERAADERTYSDVILLELPDGEFTAVTIDEFTVIRRAP